MPPVCRRRRSRYPGIREAANPPPPPPKPGDFWGGFTERARSAGGFTGAPPSAATGSNGPSLRDIQDAVDAVREFLKGALDEQQQETRAQALAEDHADVSSRWLDSGDLVVRLKVSRSGIRAMRRESIDLWTVAQQVGKNVADEMVAAIEEDAEASRAPPPRRRTRV